ncbi:bifunctional [glutamate--ammonia ligase]-adenylyl-L-tyrosine phosphorylase/[glutamate--ammonia-ligase] adenylyltransferase [Legionella sp. km772]|uniref:bifunctional [glutamate--ammonia ligase]-adenylyl-L-tyrosine phosphorylase/[glutamate--ammonia-ligase] adenylyltransferase n=1 Tax=Legionella sp. km772 TaxID=2498111 RepID=UPI000F8ECE9B|nr:bifunctional [glutamate--ammonia ligase]-adenylyl-L-tyrosine phosphorylase/[glutamate--ammonia-ligase] adenylyltransferase [Legionella sp. km772]RUR09379.1 bifunctional [glutamate--ammonia ligase]-adenylyl-L-tyrosine phosphorylase/[glutamate--ammonia-ligase] adenylyltransferase [Legionella sp. km772]
MTTPQFINPELLSAKKWLIDKYTGSLTHPLKEAAALLLLVSDYAGKQVSTLIALLEDRKLNQVLSREDYFSEINQINLEQTQTMYASMLRQHRHRYLLQLLLLEYAGLIDTEQAMRAWSHCADALILHCLNYCQKKLSERYGSPRDEQGELVSLYTLAMGKLGGQELNYSSDVDLIFAFSKAGHTDGAETLSNQEYFVKVIQLFMQILQTITAEGFVFRVDLRLRPNGDSGSLVLSLAAMETYYQEQGRDWERYAMVKARIIEESLEAKSLWFEQLITPFVYRRYVDFSVIESLRSMKAMIEREVQLNPRLDDMKRGQGGIREVEFIIQSIQLIRGGRLPQLRSQNALVALAALKKEQLLPRCDVLRQAYLYLRKLENIVQSLNDQQIHSLPVDALKQSQVCLAMKEESWDSLVAKLHQYQRIISHSFRTILGKVEDYEDAQRLLAHQITSLWHGQVEQGMAINLLTSLGFVNAEYCYQMLYNFRHGSKCRRLSQAARLRLDRFMVLLLTQLNQYKNTDTVLLQVIHLLENIVGRSAYLALLTENMQALQELLFWFSHSPFISSLVASHPFLLEVLLEPKEYWRPNSRQDLEKKLGEQLKHLIDVESKAELLRQFKLTHWLMAARSELYDLSSSVRIGKFLADLAEVIVKQVFELASTQLEERYPGIKCIKSRFAIIAYGKLGSREMNYSSDLDLVFLYTAEPSEESLVIRLTQKIVHMLTTRSQAGVLFSVDTRLRPSGSSGLLVSRLQAFIDYQKNQAWTWEHQALLKARVLYGDVALKRQFSLLKKQILSLERDPRVLRQDVREMRAKIDQHQARDPIKHLPGGLLDLEFLIQYLVLYTREKHLASYTHPLSQLKQLLKLKVVSKNDYWLLYKAYQQCHHLLHRQTICFETGTDKLLLAQQIKRLCERLYKKY